MWKTSISRGPCGGGASRHDGFFCVIRYPYPRGPRRPPKPPNLAASSALRVRPGIYDARARTYPYAYTPAFTNDRQLRVTNLPQPNTLPAFRRVLRVSCMHDIILRWHGGSAKALVDRRLAPPAPLPKHINHFVTTPITPPQFARPALLQTSTPCRAGLAGATQQNRTFRPRLPPRQAHGRPGWPPQGPRRSCAGGGTGEWERGG